MGKSVSEKLKEFLESEEGKKSVQAFIDNENLKSDILEGRFLKFDKYLETNSFDALMDRMKIENGEEHIQKCYDKGFMPFPTNLLGFIIDYASERGEEVDYNVGGGDFLYSEHEYRGYLFQTYCGQGCFDRIHKKVDGEWVEFLQT